MLFFSKKRPNLAKELNDDWGEKLQSRKLTLRYIHRYS